MTRHVLLFPSCPWDYDTHTQRTQKQCNEWERREQKGKLQVCVGKREYGFIRGGLVNMLLNDKVCCWDATHLKLLQIL